MPPSANQPPSNTRRLLLQAMASTAVGFAPALKAIADDAVHSFPDGFVWGVAASAAQTESRDGRGRSNWDIFADRAGAIADGSSNVLCTEFEQRYSQDLSLLSAAGVKAFRFSIAWPRIQPDGPGAPSAQGLAFYDRLVDAMLERGMVPWPTIFHWDVPVWAGDFRDRSIAQRLADHAGIIGRKLGDRVRDWIVMNEPNSVALRGYGGSVLAPALNSPPAALAAVHHQNLAQGLAFQSLRAVLPAGCHIGTTISVAPIRPEGGRAENITAARTVDALWNRAFLDPLYGKGYPDLLKEHLAPLVKEGDMEIIAARPDFLGVNYYMCFYVKAAGEAPFGVAPGEPPPGLPRTAYFQVEPDGLTEVLSSLDADYGHPDLYVTETGFALNDPAPRKGIVDDPQRVRYLASYLRAAQAAVGNGARLNGLFYWSATDNWEWVQGFSKTFGLIHVDRATQARTPKRSLHFYADCIRRNAVA